MLSHHFSLIEYCSFLFCCGLFFSLECIIWHCCLLTLCRSIQMKDMVFASQFHQNTMRPCCSHFYKKICNKQMATVWLVQNYVKLKSIVQVFFFMRVVGLVLVHLNNVQVHVNFKQNISMTLFIVAYLYVKKSCLNHLHQQKLPYSSKIRFSVAKKKHLEASCCTLTCMYYRLRLSHFLSTVH